MKIFILRYKTVTIIELFLACFTYILEKFICLKLNYTMDIQTKNLNLKVDLPITTERIEKYFNDLDMFPLRYAIVKVDKDILTINVTFKNL